MAHSIQSYLEPTRLRQIALLTEDLTVAEDQLTTVLGTEVVFQDPQVAQWGLTNILVALGGDIIEVVSPFRENTTAGRLLQKRGEGGYMIIMQNLDAATRRAYIESQGLSRVIFSYSHDDVECIQYHPKGIPGGMMPELDSHRPSVHNPTPLLSQFSPWHACGPDYNSYSTSMKRNSHLRLLEATCRLAPGDADTEAAARKWESIFGVAREGGDLRFTNARLRFTKGVPGLPEGLQSITIGVEGTDRYDSMLRLAREKNLFKDGVISMLGIEWHFVILGNERPASKI